MRTKYETAKNQGLNWQALLIEETQTEIKVKMQDMILKKQPLLAIKKAVREIIENCIKDLENEELKAICENTLYNYASKCYNILISIFKGVDYYILGCLVAVSENRASAEQNSVVESLRNTAELEIPETAYNVGVPLQLFGKIYMKKVFDRIDALTNLEAKEDYTSKVNLRNIAEIQIRAERHEEELNELRERGVNLVWIVPHSNCSERCEKWQGKLYSLDNTDGVIDGISYQPLKNATDIYETTKSGKVYKNGCISGFNCRHTLEEYKKGNKPVEIPAKVVAHRREINDKQRYLERGVRKWKEKAQLLKGIDKKEYLKAKLKAENWNSRYIDYSKKNGVAYYPDRTKII